MNTNSKKQKLLLITTSFPQTGNGAEAAGGFVEDLCTELSLHAEFVVVAPALVASVNTITNSDSTYAIHRFRVPKLPLSTLRPTNPSDLLSIMVSIRNGGTCIEEIIKIWRPDHILCLWALPSGYWARKIKHRLGVPYSVWTLGSDIWSLGKIPVIRTILSHVIHDAKYCFSDGLQLATDTQAIGQRECAFLPSARMLDITTSLPGSAPPFKLAFLGRWHPNKGTDLLLDALALLSDDDWALIKEIRIAGGGILEGQIKAQAASLQQTGRPIIVEGYKNKIEAIAMLSNSDYVLIPSRIESIPVIFSDALQCRRPIVTTPVGDLKRLMERYDVGICSSEASSIAFANAIKQALRQNPSQYLDNIDRASNDFRINKVAEKLISIFSGKTLP